MVRNCVRQMVRKLREATRTLPAIRWKLQNLERLRREQPVQFAAQHTALAERLDR